MLLQALFRKLDADGNGALELNELLPVTRAFTQHWDESVHRVSDQPISPAHHGAGAGAAD